MRSFLVACLLCFPAPVLRAVHLVKIALSLFFFFFLSLCPKGLVPKPEVQRETHEAAEHSERPETRVLPRPEEDESAGRETGAGRAWTLLLLWR